MAGKQWIVHHYVAVILILACAIKLSLEQSTPRAPPSSTSGSATASVVSDGREDGDTSSLAKGVKPLYDMTKVFLGKVVQPHRIYNYFNISTFLDGSYFKNFSEETWKPLAEYLVGFLVCAIIGVLFIIIFPIVGLIFCCCRCCGRCGGKAGSHDPKRAKCKRVSCGIILTVINTLMLASVVCMFFTNELLHIQTSDTENGAISHIQKHAEDLQRYINESYRDLQDNTLSLYDEKIWSPPGSPGEGRLLQEINSTSSGALDVVLKEVNVTEALDKAKKLGQDVNATLDSLVAVEYSLTNLTTLGSLLHDNLTRLKDDIEKNSLGDVNCPQSHTDDVCTGPLAVVRTLKVDANFSQLDRLVNISATVRNDVNIQVGIDAAESKINGLKSSAKSKVEKEVNRAETVASNIRDDIVKALNSIEQQLTQLNLPEGTEHGLSDAKKFTAQFGKYWWYGGIGVSCICLLVVVFIYFGLLYGFCGERPGEDAQCCNRGLGANLLMAGVGFSFIFSWVLMIVTVVLFLPGGVVFTEVCRYLNTHNPEDLQILNPLTDQALKGLSGGKYNLTLEAILQDCKQDKGIYDTLQLDHLFDLQQYLNLTSLDDVLDDIGIADIELDNLTVPDSLIQELRNFGNAGFENINISLYRDQIHKNLTSVDLNYLAGLLEQVGRELETTTDPHSHAPRRQIQERLTEQASQLRTLDSTIVNDMKREVAILTEAVNKLEEKINIKTVTQNLIDAINQAESNFNSHGRSLLKSILPNQTAKVKLTVKTFTNDVYVGITTKVGKCRPVYDAIYGASDIACLDVLDPLNGFWFSLGWCLFFFIPSIIFSVKLAGLYRKEDKYVPGIRNSVEVSPEIYSNGETHSDTIPLTSMNKPGRPESNGGMPNSGFHRDEFSQKAPYEHLRYPPGPRDYASGDGYYPGAGRYPQNGYGAPPRGYHGYPNGMSSSGYPGPPLEPPIAHY